METADGEPELQLFSNGVGGSPKDLLRQLSIVNSCRTPPEAAPRGEIELSLGLSLGGCFGMDHSPRNGLRRSASITFAPFLQNAAHESGSGAVLKRTCSLPAEEPQSWKKRRAENLDGFPLLGEDQADCGFSRGKLEFEKICDDSPRRMNDLSRTGNRIVRIAALSQGSFVSQGSSSSGFSDLDSRLPRKGPSPSSPQNLFQTSIRVTSESARNPSGEEEGFPRPAENGRAAGGGCERTKGMMKEMPCVSTTGKGPNGRRIEGFLYRFSKGEEVRIVCVCHGRFLSPAEFVKHAGGGEVAHPLKHIIVNPPRPCFS